MITQRYRTRQRQRIMEYLTEHSHEHLTADDIALYFQQGGERIGKSTVYRYLDYLVQEGIVRRFHLDNDGAACYQFIGEREDCHLHLHLKCSKCGELFHVDSPTLSKIDREMEDAYGFAVDHTKTVLYGDCGECRQKGGKS